ncbi:succinate dehydrogenase assembly factor 2-A, mitochondrial-like [Onthophagus taurus]|uniref:succinate dehydrogenase assembly factor 2-A, mitochondrial-like n=1 Tax=Onthophagus taurus TaxID=166361 RepID=UPI000C207872|nr:succinate dehydrogenase assembly factor 2-A, mitochondrial-like [Onthophagus taurus]
MSGLLRNFIRVKSINNHNKWLFTTVKLTREPDDIVHFPDKPTVAIKEYESPREESMDTQRARLLYQSRKRAILENDLLLSNFADQYLKRFNKDQLDSYDNLINRARNDWDIFYWITNKEPTPEEFQSDVLEMIKKFVGSRLGKGTLRQPDLN